MNYSRDHDNKHFEIHYEFEIEQYGLLCSIQQEQERMLEDQELRYDSEIWHTWENTWTLIFYVWEDDAEEE